MASTLAKTHPIVSPFVSSVRSGDDVPSPLCYERPFTRRGSRYSILREASATSLSVRYARCVEGNSK